LSFALSRRIELSFLRKRNQLQKKNSSLKFKARPLRPKEYSWLDKNQVGDKNNLTAEKMSEGPLQGKKNHRKFREKQPRNSAQRPFC
jgi:hypothetical protein